MSSSKNKVKIAYFVLISVLIISAIFSVYFMRNWSIIGYVIKSLTGTEQVTDPSIVLYLSFDDPNNPWKDYSIYNHEFTVNGDVNWLNKTYCKWYSCANFSVTDGSDYLNSSTKFKLDNGIAISFWVYYPTAPSSSSSSSELGMGHLEDGNRKHTQSSSYGRSAEFYCENGIASAGTGQSNRDNANEWIHYFLQYGENNIYIWKNGELLVNSSEPYGNLNYSVGELLYIGRIAPWGSTNLKGYLDEFILWNRSNFTSVDVERIYNTTRLGTPPNLDIYVKSIKYDLPYDWDDPENKLTAGTMDIEFIIANAGITDSSNFDYSFTLNDNEICSGTINIPANSQLTIVCPWQTSYGFHKGFITVDSSNSQSEDIETNNIQRVYIPFLDRPWFHFNLDEWKNDLKPYCQDPINVNDPAGQICTRWLSHFAAQGFNSGWDCNSVDPYGQGAYQMALGCAYNNYNMSRPMCQQAMTILQGWANTDPETCTNIQGTHYLTYVGQAFDIMVPVLTEEGYNDMASKFQEKCQAITRLVRPDKDNDGIIQGDNGKGFGAGNGGFCYTMIGADKNNPTLILETEQSYYGPSIADEWMDREVSYLRSYKNDAYAQYQEGLSYKWYAEPHLLSNWWFEKRYDLVDNSMYGNAFCAMARETLSIALDFNYNGKTLRNSRNSTLRFIQRGDSHSYDPPGSNYIESLDVILFEGLLCDDENVKSSALWLRNKMQQEQIERWTYPSAYLYKLLKNQAELKLPKELLEKFMFDNANDILVIKKGYTYINDTIIQIDGGEERGGGHSQAQGYYLYALGEPFLDYEQVPYNDDIRAETWKNGISLQDATQTIEGTSGTYSATCGNADLNQYYGMQDCPTAYFSTDYPNYRIFPLEYGGDLEDYLGIKDTNFAGVYVWRPYKNANPVKEYFVKFNNLLAKRTVVTNNQQGEIFHNFINIYDEFEETRNGNNLTFKRTRWDNKNVYLDIDVIHTTKPLTLGGGLTNVNYCFAKTSCEGSSRGKGKYRRTYLYAAEQDIDFILAHHWYYEGEKIPIGVVGDTDKGLKQNNNIIIFDTNNDGSVIYEDKQATGWALAYNENEIAAFNTTLIKDGSVTLLESDRPLSAHLKRSSEKLVLTANTMERDPYIDVPKTARVTIDAQELFLNSNFQITKNDEENINIIVESGTKLNFNIITDQNSDYYTIVGNLSGNLTFCGDNTCNADETCSNCSQDCGACPTPTYCGDNICQSNESCSNCVDDCGECLVETTAPSGSGGGGGSRRSVASPSGRQ